MGFLLIAGLVIVSCSSNNKLLEEYQKKQDYYKYLQKTEKLQLKENNITKVLVTATYMNKTQIKNNDKSDEVFLIALYSEDEDVLFLTDESLNIKLKDVKSREEIKLEKKLLREKKRDYKKRGEEYTIDKKEENEKKYINPLDVKLVDKNSPILKGISFISDWNQFYLVRYKHIEGNRLVLRIKSSKYGQGFLYFAKIAKYAL